jgi:hypothetical protein
MVGFEAKMDELDTTPPKFAKVDYLCNGDRANVYLRQGLKFKFSLLPVLIGLKNYESDI